MSRTASGAGSTSLTTFMNEISGGQFELGSAMLGPYTINQNRPAGCNWETQFVPAAKALAIPAGNSLVTYDLQDLPLAGRSRLRQHGRRQQMGRPQSFSYINGMPCGPDQRDARARARAGHTRCTCTTPAPTAATRGADPAAKGSQLPRRVRRPVRRDEQLDEGTTPIPVRQFSSFHKAQLASRGLRFATLDPGVSKSGTYQLAPSNVTRHARSDRADDLAPQQLDGDRLLLPRDPRETGVFDDFNCASTPNPCDSVQIRIGPRYSADR